MPALLDARLAARSASSGPLTSSICASENAMITTRCGLKYGVHSSWVICTSGS